MSATAKSDTIKYRSACTAFVLVMTMRVDTAATTADM
jgi:hypothetical protein